jgi:ribosomal protein L28
VSSRHCQLTGRKPGFGKQVSHSHRRGIESVVADLRARGEKV